jgi:hypothetical protein
VQHVRTDATVEAVRDAILGLRMTDDPSPFDEGAVEYAILKSGLEEDDLEEFGLRPVDPVDAEVLEVGA